jgi:hypothetical protein
MSELVPPQSKIKSLVGRRQSKNVKFMGEDIKITKLSTGQVQEVQDLSKEIQKAAAAAAKAEAEAPGSSAQNDDNGLSILRFVVRTSVEGADSLTNDDFLEFPLGDLNKLVEDIMEWSGVDQGK